MLNELQPDMQELIELIRATENHDATIASSQLHGKPIKIGVDAQTERQRKGRRIEQLRSKWNI